MYDIEWYVNELPDTVRRNLQGGFDFHLHGHVAEGYRWNLREVAEQCVRAGMSGVMIKNLYGTSQEMCHAVNQQLEQPFFYP